MKRNVKAALACLSCLFLLLGGLSRPAAAQARRPNFVFIITDDQRWDSLGVTGHPYARTPNIDRLARDTAEDLRPHGVTSVSLYPGLVLTESVVANLHHFSDETDRETPLFVGRTGAALAADPDVLRLTGRWRVAAEVAAAYGSCTPRRPPVPRRGWRRSGSR